MRTTKRDLRARVRAARAAVPDGERAALAPAWTAGVLGLDVVSEARVVAAYTSYGTEPPTRALIEALLDRGVQVLLPVLLDDRDLDWVDARDSSQPPVRLGVDAVATADAVVVPALLAGLDGTRLGQGGGSYDRALPRVPTGTPIVALVHDDELLESDAIPCDRHDIAVTHVVTPTRAVAVVPTGVSGHVRGDLPIDPDATPEFAYSAFDHRHPRRWDIAVVIAIGGALGSLARWGLNEAVPHSGRGFPWSTFVENVSGCFVLGVVMVLVLDVWKPRRYTRPFVGIGLLGGFTTFSTYTVDARSLFAADDAQVALVYLFGTLIVGLLATWIGITLGRAVAGRPFADARRGQRA